MGKPSKELFQDDPPDRSRIPESIRLHPKLDQASKFCWVYLWEQAGFRPNTINATPARIGAALGKSERSAKRWLASLQEAGCIELVDRPKRGEWLFYVTALHARQDTLGIPSVQISTGTSGPVSPIQNEETGTSGPLSPIQSEPEIIPQTLSHSEAAQLAELRREIDLKRSQMPRSAFGISGVGTALADCKLSKEFKLPETVDGRQLANAAPVSTEPSRAGHPSPPPAPLQGAFSPAVAKALESLAIRAEGADTFNSVYDWLRTEFPDEEDVFPQLLRRIATAVVTGKMEKAALSEIVENSKADRVRDRNKWFCSAVSKACPKIKPR